MSKKTKKDLEQELVQAIYTKEQLEKAITRYQREVTYLQREVEQRGQMIEMLSKLYIREGGE